MADPYQHYLSWASPRSIRELSRDTVKPKTMLSRQCCGFPDMVAAQTTMMRLKTDSQLSVIPDKRSEPQEGASYVDKEDPAKTRASPSPPLQDDDAARESGDLFGDSRAQGKQLQKSGQYEQALELYRKALQCKNKTLGSEPKDVQATFGDILYDIGSIHLHSEYGDPEQSVEAYHFCLEVRRTCFGSTHPCVARVLYKLASVHSLAGDQEFALHLLLEALSIFLCATPGSKSTLHNVWTAIGNVQQALGYKDEAKSAFEEAAQCK